MESMLPQGLVKKLVGESLLIQIRLNPKFAYEIKLTGTLTSQGSDGEKTKTKFGYQIKVPLIHSGIYQWQISFRRLGSKAWKRLTDQRGRPQMGRVQVDPSWLSQAIAYCIFVRFFKGKVAAGEINRQPATITADNQGPDLETKKVGKQAAILPGEGGTFDDVKAHLQKLKAMHVNVLYFNPIHTIGEIFRGYNMLDQLPGYLQPGSPYSVKDYKAIDPELAYDKDNQASFLSDPQQEFKDLVKAAHELGMFVVMDLVFNHTAHDFVYQRIHPEWYLYKNHINSLDEPYLYPEDVQRGLPWGDPRHSLSPYDHGFWWEDCAQLNWEYRMPPGANEPPPNYTLKVMWQFFKSVPQYWLTHFNVDGFRCDVAYRIPTAFWKACISEARICAKKLSSNLAHDVVFIAESYTDDLETLQQAGFSAVYGDFSHKLQSPLKLKGYLDYIYNLEKTQFPLGSKWFHFPDSHDFDRTPRKVLPGPLVNSETALLANQSRWVLTATLPGIPLIFNGFEKIEWQPINIWSYGAIDWDKEADLQQFIAKINNIRRHSVALAKGDYHYIPTNQGLHEQTQLFAFSRQFKEETILVVTNMDVLNQAGPAKLLLPESWPKRFKLHDLISDEQFEREGKEITVVLPPGQSHIFQVF
ncbi:hypothetical protein A2W24_01970 [Microgenomates group bacterium RBG_16_45_19]|nr:MAG: hypothetical protein A2W24_01970 [Microgenomates group bacterium RBG_16_45_19]